MGLYGNTDKAQNSAIAKNATNATTTDVTVAALAANVVTLDGTGTAIPVADPAVAGAIWSNAGVLTVSAG